MKKSLGLVLVLLVVVALSQAGIYWVGTRTETRMHDFASRNATLGAWHYTLVSYDRHFYDADAVSEISLSLPQQPGNPMNLPPVSLRLNHHITHGPRLGHLVAASVETTLMLSDEIKARLKPLFGEQAPVTEVTDIALSGAQDGTVSSPAVSGPLAFEGMPKPVNLDWGGLQGGYTLSADGKTASLKITQPKTTITSDLGNLGIENLEMSGNGQASPDLENIWFGTFGVSIAGIHVDQAGQKIADLDKLAINADMSSEPTGLRLTEEFSLDKFAAAAVQLDKADFKFSLSALDGPALAELSARMRALQGSTPDIGQQMAQMQSIFKELAPKFLAKKPMLSIDNLGVSINGQPLAAKGSVQYVGAGALDQFNLLTDLDAAVSFGGPQALIQSLATEAMQRQLSALAQLQQQPVDEAKLQAQAAAQAQQSLQQLIAQKILVVQGDQLHGEASLHQGKILVNGAPFQGMPQAAGP